MKLKCLNCGREFEGSVSYDDLGWHSLCSECGSSFDVDLPKGKIVMAFVNDEDPEKDWEHFTDDWRGNDIRTYYAFDTPEEFMRAWRKMEEDPDGMWYWVLVDGQLICSGACDPNDEEIFADYFGFEAYSGFGKERTENGD